MSLQLDFNQKRALMSSLSFYVQVSPDLEETLDFQVVQHRVMTEPGVRMVVQGALEPRVSPERY